MAAIHANFRPRRERVPVFSDAALARLIMPVMLIVGARDVMLDSMESKARLEKAVPHVKVRLLPEAGASPSEPGGCDCRVSWPEHSACWLLAVLI